MSLLAVLFAIWALLKVCALLKMWGFVLLGDTWRKNTIFSAPNRAPLSKNQISAYILSIDPMSQTFAPINASSDTLSPNPAPSANSDAAAHSQEDESRCVSIEALDDTPKWLMSKFNPVTVMPDNAICIVVCQSEGAKTILAIDLMMGDAHRLPLV